MTTLKLILLGHGPVGKTAIINQFLNGTFLEESIGTLKQDKSTEKVFLDNGKKSFNLEIWDTIGGRNYWSGNKLFMKKVNIALIVYDITNRESFDVLNEFYEQIDEVNGKENVFFAIVGNKSDLYEDQIVSKESGGEYAISINALFYETSATDHESIEYLFKDIVTNYVEAEIKFSENSIYQYKSKRKKEYKNGDIYEEIINLNKKRNGYGTMKYYNGDIYDGNWVNDLKEGYGIMK